VDETRSAESADRSVSGVRFKILGPIEVTSGDVPVRIPPGRQPIILGALLLEPNRVVSIDRLIDVVWPDDPPATARSQVQICVSALRHMFTGLGIEQPIVTRPPGYLLRVADGQIDSQTFTKLAAEAAAAQKEGQLEEAVALFRRGLALWRGRALGGGEGSVLRSAAVRLDEAKLAALETCIDLELKLGREQALIGELGSLVAEYPLQERLRAQLMLALYRAGRPAEALEVYQAGRKILVEELGLEPSEELRNLEAKILAEDPTLQPEPREEARNVETRPQVGPRQLPADIVDFTNRTTLIEQAEAAVLGDGSAEDDSAVRVAVIAGKAGIGKSALAIHVAHRVATKRFPDGQLYCQLGGTQRKPVTPSEVLGRFLRALGMPGSAIPDEVDERAEMYRSLLADRKLLVVLDDVATVRQVTPLLPGSGSCAVILTSRMRLTEIAGARVLDVSLLQPDHSMDLLGKVIGDKRVAGESTAATALVRMVGGLPLALRIVAARLAARPHWSLASMVGRLADERRRLDELSHGDMMVRASLLLTYEGLDPRAARLFRLLGSLPPGTFPGWVAAALLDEDPIEAADLLEQLVDMQMLDVTGPDLDGLPRYGFHAIIRLFAREQLARESREVRQETMARMLGGWLARAERAHRELYGGEYAILRGNALRWWPAAGDDPGALPVDPQRYLEAESVNLIAAVGQAADEGFDELAWELAVHLVSLFVVGGYVDEWQHTHDRALEVVRSARNRRGEAALLVSLGELYLTRGRYAAARAVLTPAQELFVELGDAHGLALARRNLAHIEYNEGSVELAFDGYSAALEGFRQVGSMAGQAHVLSKLAVISADQGNDDRATDQLGEALEICRESGNRRIEGQVLYKMGQVLLRQRRLEEADLVLGAALELVRANHELVGEGYVLYALGLTQAKLGRRAEARESLRQAVELRERILDHVGAAKIRVDLAPLLDDYDEPGAVADLVEQPRLARGERRVAGAASEVRRALESFTDPEHVTN
jgi:DNA-binding SARP family transcriptional activator/Tfp pilus assembly protein PilF